ncbi:MAG: recombinase XerC [Treponema sp. CETP13]|nr:MAG: recombinase XerC [Treponema sp. CETP13]
MEENSLKNVIEEFLAYIYGVRNLSVNTVSAYRNDLSKLQKLLIEKKEYTDSSQIVISEVSIEDLRYCIGRLSKQRKSAASINRFIASVRNFFAYCHRFSYIKSNVALELKTVKKTIKVPRFMSTNEINSLCVQPQERHLLWETRDRSLFEMLYSSGCRVSEIASLTLADFSPQRDSAMIKGKGGKDRRVYFSEEAVAALNKYLPERKATLLRLKKTTTAVFISQKGTHITSGGIQYIVRRYSSIEGSNNPVTPHAFRHTFATQLLNNGANIRVVQELLGHSSISTTQRYTHVTSKSMIEAYNKAHPHNKGK